MPHMATKRKPAPKGSHYMPNGKLMKNSVMKKASNATKKKPNKKLGY